MATKAQRAQAKAEREQWMAEVQKVIDFRIQGFRDLADGKISLDELKSNPIFEKIMPEDKKMFFVMNSAIKLGDHNLVTLILEEGTDRSLNLIWSDAEFILRKWIERNGDQVMIDLYSAITSAHNQIELNRGMVHGELTDPPLFVKMIREKRQELLNATQAFSSKYPELENWFPGKKERKPKVPVQN